MDYSQIIEVLNNASGFDLYRLRSAIDNMIDDPQRLIEVRLSLRLGQNIEYYEPSHNRVYEGVVEKIKQTRVVVKCKDDGRRWDIHACAINLRKVAVDIDQHRTKGLTRNEISIGERVGFIDNAGNECSGKVLRLNPKTVTVACEHENGTWRVSYCLLHKVIELEAD